MDNPVIQTTGLSKRFGRLTAVDELTLAVPAGQVLALMGANGAGKTTRIRMLLGLRRPDAGSASVLGLDPEREGVRLRQQIGYVPETHHFYPWMRIGEVCRFAAGAYPTVERVVDHAAFIDGGRLRFVEDVESLRERFREIRLTFAAEAPETLALPGVLQATRLGREWVAVIGDVGGGSRPQGFRETRERFPQAEFASRVLTLQEIFVALQRAAGVTPQCR